MGGRESAQNRIAALLRPPSARRREGREKGAEPVSLRGPGRRDAGGRRGDPGAWRPRCPVTGAAALDDPGDRLDIGTRGRGEGLPPTSHVPS